MFTSIAIIGRPNVGKSSLFNKLTRSRDAIVSDFPGLTKDRNYGYFESKNKKTLLIDTGGISESNEDLKDVISAQAWIAVQESSLVIFLIDGSEELTKVDQDIVENLRKFDKEFLTVLNKIDKSPIEDIKVTNSLNFYKVSAKSGEGVNFLLQEILSFVIDNTKKIRNTNNFYSSNRQKKELEAIKVLLDLALKEDQEEILAEFIREIYKGFGRILGHVDIEEVLGEIFSNFCIGK